MAGLNDKQINLPTLHPGQVTAYMTPGRFKAIRCGRRWGKTDLAKTIVCDGVIKGQSVGFFAPDYRITAETFNEIATTLDPIIRSSSKTEGIIRAINGGRIDFWTLENPRAGRSRKYHKAVIDEAAFTKPNMMQIWNTSIKPTLLDYRGTALALSNTNGVDPDNFFWRVCNEPEHRFRQFHAPTHTNPYLPAEELARLVKENAPLVYQQEYLAEFVDWSGTQFFNLQDCLVDGQPTETPAHCDGVYATIDTAVKTGRDNDGTAVMYWAISRFGASHRLILLDWDIVQVEGALLEVWLPSVFARIEQLARQTGARAGSLGAYIEDKASGMILLQQALRRGWPAQAIDSKLTSVGKDERAISVSGYVFQKKVGISRDAYDKVSEYKLRSRNHMLGQVFNYRLGSKDQEDDLFDTWCYGIALGLGDSAGF